MGNSNANKEDEGPVASQSVTQHVQVIVGVGRLKSLDDPRFTRFIASKLDTSQVMPDGRVKDAALESLLKTHHSDGARVIVFCLYKKEAERVEQTLLRKGWKCVSLHGDKSQAERTRAFNAFRDKECNLLVATDVAARGVDLPNVEHVINYTFPLTIEDYVHRIGRTGRGDSVGHSWTFFTTADKAHAGALVNVLQTAKQEVPKDMFQFSLATKRKGAACSSLSSVIAPFLRCGHHKTPKTLISNMS